MTPVKLVFVVVLAALALVGVTAHDCLDANPIVAGGAKGAAHELGGNDPAAANDMDEEENFLQLAADDLPRVDRHRAEKDWDALEPILAPVVSHMVAVEIEARAQVGISFTDHKNLAVAPAWLTIPGALTAWPAMPGGAYAAGSHHARVAAMNTARTFVHNNFGVIGAGTLESRARVDIDVFLMALVTAFNNDNALGYGAVHLVAERHVPATNWRTAVWPVGAPAIPAGQDHVNGHIDYAITNAAGTRIYMVVEAKAYNHAEMGDGSGRRQAAMEAAAAMAINMPAGLHPVPFVLTDGDDFYFYLLTRGAATLDVSYYGTYRAALNFNSRRNIFLRLRLLLTVARAAIGP